MQLALGIHGESDVESGHLDRKPSGQYLAITLADKTGQFEARMWEDFAGVLDTCSAGCYVKAQGTVSKYQGKFQITLSKMRLAAAVEIDTADFIPTSQYDIPTMAAELRGYVAAFRNPHLRRLVLAFLDDSTLGPQFIEAPAAKRLHHAWLGGLLEHVVLAGPRLLSQRAMLVVLEFNIRRSARREGMRMLELDHKPAECAIFTPSQKRAILTAGA